MSAIEQIGQSIKNIEANYEQFDDAAFNNGGIAEYSAIVHKKLLKEIMELFKAIAKSPDLLSSEFSISEMNEIATLAENLVSDQYNGGFLNENNNRRLMSRMRVVFGEKRALQYKSEVDKLQGLIVRVEDMLKEEKRVSSMKEVIDGINAQLNDITKSQEQAQQGLKDVQDKSTKAEGVLNSVNTTSEDIKAKHPIIVAFFEEIMKNQETLKKLETQNTDFVQKMEKDEKEYKEKREENLQKSQEENTKFVQEMKENEEGYKEKREENLQELQVQKTEFYEKLEKDYAEYLKKRDEMKKTADEMLGLANASGLAAAFSQRINKWHLLWLLGAFVFIMGAIVTALHISGIDIPWLLGMDPAFGDIWARISITTLPLLVAYFCAAQYSKSDRTLEDYQYKKALAQSMPAFIEQLGKGNDEYLAYMSLALQQMLQDPLRKKHDVPLPLKDFLETLFEKSPKDKPEKKDGDS